MTRRQWLFLLAGLLLLGLAAGWFYTHFEQVTVKTHAPPEAEARRNPYLALERFFARMDAPCNARRMPVFSTPCLPAACSFSTRPGVFT